MCTNLEYHICMKDFADCLKYLMENNELTVPKLAKNMNFKTQGTIYSWLNTNRVPKLDNAIKIADYFKCSLDFLFGRTRFDENKKFCTCPPFDVQLKKVLKENGVSQNKLIRDLELSGGYVYAWFKLKRQPTMDILIRIADYLGVSLDYLVGREK